MASYLEVISVVDHHKIALNTSIPPMALIGDAQSSNVLIAEQTFLINDRYSTHPMADSAEGESLRIQQRRLSRKMAEEERGDYYVHPLREYTEYLSFLYAILDDTDLLAKVSKRDVLCVVELLNRMKSLSVGDEVEVVSFADIPRDGRFAQKAAKRLLQSDELYSLYQIVYRHREESVEQQLKEKSLALFADTKEQNGCGRVGQTKLFSANFPTFKKKKRAIQALWLEQARAAYKKKPKLDLHIQMVSTISGAEEVYCGDDVVYTHRDEMWIWCADIEEGMDHLARFLSSFHQSSAMQGNKVSVELGGDASGLEAFFAKHFPGIPVSLNPKGASCAVLHFNPGSINSRKAMISPHIPRVI